MTNKKTNNPKAKNKDNKQKIKPNLTESFRGSVIKEIISNVVANVLEGQEYNVDQIPVWISKIADTVNTQVLDLNMKRYKHIVQVVIVEKGAGCRWTSDRCLYNEMIKFLATSLGADGTQIAIAKPLVILPTELWLAL